MYIKTIFRYCFLLVFVVSMFFENVQPTFAQEVAPGDQVTFTQLQVGDITLKGPLGSNSVRFTLPADWQLSDGAELHLNMHVFAGEALENASGSVRPVSGFLTIRVNGIWVETITLDHDGDYALVIPIPSNVWLADPRNARQTLRFSLESAQSCDMIMAALERGIFTGLNVLIQPSSFLVLPHQAADIPLDLKLMPYPIFQRSFIPDSAILVMPAKPTEGELQAVMTAASAFGRTTQKALPLEFVTADQVDPEMLAQSHAILVGKPDSLPLVGEAKWPLAVSNGKFDAKEVFENDGVLQLAVSPRNKAKAWLWISGDTDQGVVKAAQALSGVIRTGSRPDVAIVADVTPSAFTATKADLTFEELGYESQTFVGIDDFSSFYWIDIPLDYTASDGAYLDLVYSNSALLNFDEASLSLQVNNQFVGGLRFNDRSTSSSTFRFNIPGSLFRGGSNQLVLNMSLKSATPCISSNDIWASIWPTSLLHIPVEPLAPETLPADFQLSAYPKNLFPLFANTTFVVAADDPSSWSAAGQVAYELGKERRGSVINPKLVFSANLTSEMHADNDLILVGKASAFPILQDLAAVMPAPFAAGSDIATERDATVSFRISSENPTGYLQVFPSAWNPRRVVLLVAGNSVDGLQSAVAALTDSNRAVYPVLFGNMAIIEGRLMTSRLVKVEQEQVAQVTPTPIPAQVTTDAPQQDLINIDLVTVGVALAGGVIILGLILWLVKSKVRKKPWES